LFSWLFWFTANSLSFPSLLQLQEVQVVKCVHYSPRRLLILNNLHISV
jgi:hypothetical protein